MAVGRSESAILTSYKSRFASKSHCFLTRALCFSTALRSTTTCGTTESFNRPHELGGYFLGENDFTTGKKVNAIRMGFVG
jgi:hypothetical protein